MDRIEAFERIMEAQQRLNKAESEVFALEMELEESDLGRRMESAKEERKRAKKALGNVMYDVSIAYQLELPMRDTEQKRSVIVGKRPEQVNTVTGEIEPAPDQLEQATLATQGTSVAPPMRVFGADDPAGDGTRRSCDGQTVKPTFVQWEQGQRLAAIAQRAGQGEVVIR